MVVIGDETNGTRLARAVLIWLPSGIAHRHKSQVVRRCRFLADETQASHTLVTGRVSSHRTRRLRDGKSKKNDTQLLTMKTTGTSAGSFRPPQSEPPLAQVERWHFLHSPKSECPHFHEYVASRTSRIQAAAKAGRGWLSVAKFKASLTYVRSTCVARSFPLIARFFFFFISLSGPSLPCDQKASCTASFGVGQAQDKSWSRLPLPPRHPESCDRVKERDG